MKNLLMLLRYSNSSGRDHRSIPGEYVHKMSFTDTAKDAGPEYVSHEMLVEASGRNRTVDMYILHFNGAAQAGPAGNEDQQTLFDLLNGQADQYRVLIVNYDVPTTKDLEKAYIEQRRGGKIIGENVTKNGKTSQNDAS